MTEEVWIDLALELLDVLKNERVENQRLTAELGEANQKIKDLLTSPLKLWKQPALAPKDGRVIVGIFSENNLEKVRFIRLAYAFSRWVELVVGGSIDGELLMWAEIPKGVPS